MTQHSTRATSTLPGNSLQGRLPKRSWPVRLVLVAALLLAVPLLFHAGSTVHAADNEITGVTVTSPNPGELSISWDTPSDAPDDYRVTWKKSSGKWASFKNENTVDGGNAFPTSTSHSVTGMEEGTAYKVRVRARYHDGNGNVQKNGPWSAAREVTVSATPPPKKGDEQGEGDSNEGRSTNPPAKPTGLLTGASHDNVLLFWTNPNDDDITGYQILRGLDAANLAVLVNDTGNKNTSYTDDTVAAETTYVYVIRARNANGLSPESDTASVTTLAPPPEEEEEETALSTDQTGILILTEGTARELRFEQHEDVDQFNFTLTAGTTYRLSIQMIWPGSNSASVSILALGSHREAFVFARSPVVLPGRADFVFTPSYNDTMDIQIKGIHWGSDSQGRHQCGTGSGPGSGGGQDDPIYCRWSSDYTIMVEEVASAAESTSPTTDVCWSYESFPDSLSTPCVMAIEDDVMGYINSQPDRDLWALVQFDEDSGYTVKVHGNVDSNNLLDNVQITLIDQWGIPLRQGSSNTSNSPASVGIGADRTYTGVYFLEVRSRDAAGAYRIEVTD